MADNDTAARRDGISAPPPPIASGAPTPNLPVPLEPARRTRLGARARTILLGALVALSAVAGGAYWWLETRNALPTGITFGNGRLEADEIDIQTKFAGRVAERFVDEGDLVRAGQPLARMDTRDMEATLKRAEAQALQSEHAVAEARSLLEEQRAQLRLARQQLERTTTLHQQGYATRELLDQRRERVEAAVAGQAGAEARLGAALRALDAARHEMELYRVNIADNLLTAPRDGRIQYRLATVGEVVAAGGRIFTMLDTAAVYMEIYLPTAEAGRVKLGTDARIVLDALPTRPIPAYVSFLADQAQFTPKAVETRSERDKLMFRVKVRIDPALLAAHAGAVRTGLPGLAYVRLDPATPWPDALRADAPR